MVQIPGGNNFDLWQVVPEQGPVVQKLTMSLVTIHQNFKHEYYKYPVIF